MELHYVDNHLTTIIQGCYKLEFTIPVGKEIMCPFQTHMTQLFFLQNTVDSIVDKTTFFILSNISAVGQVSIACI